MATKRKWLQIHLSTAVILMFTAGGLIWANVPFELTVIDNWRVRKIVKFTLCGWPFKMSIRREFFFTDQQTPFLVDNLVDDEVRYQNVALDIATAVTILGVVWFLCESWIRRRQSVPTS